MPFTKIFEEGSLVLLLIFGFPRKYSAVDKRIDVVIVIVHDIL